MSSALSLLAAVAASHVVQIEHRDMSVEVTYAVRTDIRTKTIGAHTPNRMDGRRCRWSANVLVERKPTQAPALGRAVGRALELSGSLPGACGRDRKSIARQVAAHEGRIRAHLMAVAESDRAQLLAELDATRAMGPG